MINRYIIERLDSGWWRVMDSLMPDKPNDISYPTRALAQHQADLINSVCKEIEIGTAYAR